MTAFDSGGANPPKSTGPESAGGLFSRVSRFFRPKSQPPSLLETHTAEGQQQAHMLDLSFRSFSNGQVVVGNLSQCTLYCWQKSGKHWLLSPASDVLFAITKKGDPRLERAITSELSSDRVKLLRNTTRRDSPGLLMLFLSPNETLRKQEFQIFHKYLQDHFKINSSDAMLLKLYATDLVRSINPSMHVLNINCQSASKTVQAGEGRVTIINLSENAYRYMHHFNPDAKDEIIAPLFPHWPASEEYPRKLLEAMQNMTRSDSKRLKGIMETITNHGIILLILPCDMDLHAISIHLFNRCMAEANVPLSEARGGVILFSDKLGMRL